IVRKDTQLGAREPGRVDDRGVYELVEDDDVILIAQGADRADRGGVTGRERNGGLRVLEGGEGFIELVVRRERAADETGSARAGAVTFNGVDRGLLQARVIGEPKVIVRRKIQECAAIEPNPGGLRRIHASQFAIKILRANLGKTSVQFRNEIVHVGGGMIHWPSIMLAVTSPLC